MSSPGVDAYVHRFLPASQPGHPVLLTLHGTGGDEDDLVPLGGLLIPGAAILSPRGNVLENGMPRFFRRLAEGVFDLEDLARRTQELGDWIEAARVHYRLEDRPVVAAGFSNGANVAASLLLARPAVLAGAVLFRAMVPFVPEPTPRLDGKPVWIGAGRADTMVGVEQPERLATLLRAGGADVTLSWDPGGHALMMDTTREAREWITTVEFARA